jgi:hypothetical protein
VYCVVTVACIIDELTKEHIISKPLFPELFLKYALGALPNGKPVTVCCATNIAGYSKFNADDKPDGIAGDGQSVGNGIETPVNAVPKTA